MSLQVMPSKVPDTGVMSIHPIDHNEQRSIGAISSEPPIPKGPSEKKSDWKSDWWLYEMAALFMSAVTIVLMCVFLFLYNQQAAPSWSYSSHNGRLSNQLPQAVKAKRVNFSSILALFSTLTQALLAIPLAKGLGLLTWVYFMGKNDRKLADFTVFDSAAKKSTTGAAKLLWMLKGRHFAVVGAFLVLGLQGLSFFIQQLVSLPVAYWPDSPQQIQPNSPAVIQLGDNIRAFTNGSSATFAGLPAELQIARIANATSYAPENLGPAPYYGLELPMKANIWAGLFDTDNFGGWAIPSYYCSTGNCTWTDYSSLGVCSRCADITAQLNKSCTPQATDVNNVTGCDYSLPNGFALGGINGSRSNLLAASTNFPALAYGNYTSPLAIIQSIWANDSTLFVDASTPVEATECILFPCVIKYQESIVASSQDFAKSGLNIVPYEEIVESIYDNYTFDLEDSSVSTGPTLNLLPNASEPISYHMSEAAYTGLSYYLQSMFNGFVSGNGGILSYSDDGNKSRPLQADVQDTMQALYVQGFTCFDIYGNPVYNMVSCSIISMATAITTVIRNNAFSTYNFSTYSAIGTTYSPKPTVDVTWLWIIPVVVLWLLCAILAFGTIIKTRRAGVGGMVLNPLTLLFLDIEKEEVEAHQPAWFTSKEEAQKQAQQMQVRLKMEDRKVSFVQGMDTRESSGVTKR